MTAFAASLPILATNGGLNRDSLAVIVALMAGGAAYLVAVAAARGVFARRHVIVLIAVAVILRVGALAAPVPRGDDFERYLWDGAVTAAGISPYRHAPQAVLDGTVDDPAMRPVADAGRDVLARVNHPHLRTIYPPVAQGLFAAAYKLSPFSPTAWRVVLLICDVLTALLLLALLRAARLPWALLTAYLWNPLLVFETYSRLHVDLATGPFLVLLAWAVVRRRPAVAALALVAAAGVKLWPLLLLPIVLGALWADRRRAVVFVVVAAAAGVAIALPFAAAFGDETTSGAMAYGQAWSNAPGVHRYIEMVAVSIRGTLSLLCSSGVLARAIAAAILVAFAIWQGLRARPDARELCARMGTVALVGLLLSATLWPWYYLAVLPLAAMAPRPSLLVWTLLLPLVYVIEPLAGASGTVLLVHLPVWALLIGETVLRRRAARRARNHV